jgi:hypothetical protein
VAITHRCFNCGQVGTAGNRPAGTEGTSVTGVAAGTVPVQAVTRHFPGLVGRHVLIWANITENQHRSMPAASLDSSGQVY